MRLANFQTKILSLTPVLDTDAYAAGDVLFVTTALTLAPASGPAGEVKGRVVQVTLLDKDDQGATLDLVVLRSNVALGTINAAPSISDADAEAVVALVPVLDWTDLGGCRVARAVFDPVEFTVPGTALYLAAITRGTPTHTASGLVLQVAVQLDNVEL